MASSDTASVTLRPATEADIPFLIELRRQTLAPHQLASGAESSERERDERVRYRFECAQVVELGGQPIGILKVTRDTGAWQLVQIQIASALQSRGIGSELVRRVIDDARAAGAALELRVLHTNPARRLYERLGFRVVGEGAHEFTLRWGADCRSAAALMRGHRRGR